MGKGHALRARVAGGHQGATTGVAGGDPRPGRIGERPPAEGAVDSSTVVEDRPPLRGAVVPEADVDGEGPRPPAREPARATESGAASVFKPSKP